MQGIEPLFYLTKAILVLLVSKMEGVFSIMFLKQSKKKLSSILV